MSVKGDKEYMRAWRLAHLEQSRSYNTRWRSNNIVRAREISRKSTRSYNRKKRAEIIDFLGGECVRCGFDDWRALQVDHVNGDGHIHRKQDGTTFTSKLFRTIVEDPKRFQLLCANCNWIKRYENNENRGIILS